MFELRCSWSTQKMSMPGDKLIPGEVLRAVMFIYLLVFLSASLYWYVFCNFVLRQTDRGLARLARIRFVQRHRHDRSEGELTELFLDTFRFCGYYVLSRADIGNITVGDYVRYLKAMARVLDRRIIKKYADPANSEFVCTYNID